MKLFAGVVIGLYPMKRAESQGAFLRHLDTVVYPRLPHDAPREYQRLLGMPDASYYDKACQTTRCFQPGNSLAEFRDRWQQVEWRVDSFHFMGHSADDVHCR